MEQATIASPVLTQKAPPVSSKRHKALRVLLIAVIVAIVLAVIIWWRNRGYESTDDAYIEGRIVALAPKVSGRLVEVLVRDNQAVEAGQVLARIDPRDYQAKLDQAQASVAAARAKAESAQSSLVMMKTTAAAGLEQAKAALVGAQTSVQTAEAQLGAARSRLVQSQAMIKTAEAAAAQSKAEVDVAQAEAERTSTDLKRIQELARSGSASPQELTNAAAASESSSSRLMAAKKKQIASEAQIAEAQAAAVTAGEEIKQYQSQIVAAQARVTQSQAAAAAADTVAQQVAIAEAQVRQNQADLERYRAAEAHAQLDVDETQLKAPLAGKVTRKSMEAGQYVQVGQMLMAVVSRDLWVVANFKETQLTHMRPGNKVFISVDAYPDAEFAGVVDSLQAGSGARFSLLPPENATGNFVKVVQRVPVKITFTQPPDLQKYPMGPGMSVEPSVRVKD